MDVKLVEYKCTLWVQLNMYFIRDIFTFTSRIHNSIGKSMVVNLYLRRQNNFVSI